MKKTILTTIAISALLVSLVAPGCLRLVKADSNDPISFIDSATTISSPVNMTYNNRKLTLSLTVPIWSIMGMPTDVSMNYSIDGIYNGSVPLRNITPPDAPPIATKVGIGAGNVDFPELPDGSHYLTIYLYGLNMRNYQPQFKSFVYTIYFSIDDPNSIFSPTPSATSTPKVTPSPTPSFSYSPRAQKQFAVNNTMYAFHSSELLCSFNATAGCWIELNLTVTGDYPFDTVFEVSSNTHGVIFNSTIYQSSASNNLTQTFVLNYDDSYNVTVTKQSFYSTVTIKGTINLVNQEPSTTPSPAVPELSYCTVVILVVLATTVIIVVLKRKAKNF
jgi:hypothetical protein